MSELPPDLRRFAGQVQVLLAKCWLFCSIPAWIGDFTSLKLLRLDGFDQNNWHEASVEFLPDAIGNLVALETLHLECFPRLSAIPSTISRLTSLQHLELRRCFDRATQLTEAVGKLYSLTTLVVTGGTRRECMADPDHPALLTKLPQSLGNLTSLRTLKVKDFLQLEMLPASMGSLTGLEVLHISRCSRLRLPASLSRVHVRRMRLKASHQRLFESVGAMTSLRELVVSPDDFDDSDITAASFSALAKLSALQRLFISGGVAMSAEIPPQFFACMLSLEELVLHGIDMRSLPSSLVSARALRRLRLQGLAHVQELPDLCQTLRELSIDGCPSLRPPRLELLTSLHKLRIHGCLFEAPETIACLTDLRSLSLRLQFKAMCSCPDGRCTRGYVCAEVRGAQLRNATFKILARALPSLKLLNSATLTLFHDQDVCEDR